MNKNFTKHLDCPVCVRWRWFKKQEQPTPGLYCEPHDYFIKWLSYDDYNNISADVKVHPVPKRKDNDV